MKGQQRLEGRFSNGCQWHMRWSRTIVIVIVFGGSSSSSLPMMIIVLVMIMDGGHRIRKSMKRLFGGSIPMQDLPGTN